MQGQPGVHVVPVDRERLPAGREREQVAADPAAQVGHPAGAAEPRGPVARDRLRGRLLVPGPGEQHLHRPAELRPGRQAELMLRGGRRDQVGRVLPAQPDRERERGPAAVRLGREPGQQLLPLRAEQDGRIGVHRLEASAAGRRFAAAGRGEHREPGGDGRIPGGRYAALYERRQRPRSHPGREQLGRHGPAGRDRGHRGRPGAGRLLAVCVRAGRTGAAGVVHRARAGARAGGRARSERQPVGVLGRPRRRHDRRRQPPRLGARRRRARRPARRGVGAVGRRPAQVATG